MPDNVTQYNAAVKDLSTSVAALQNASTDEARAAAEAAFQTAEAECQRCLGNMESAQAADAAIQRFKAVPVSDPNLLGMEGKEVRAYSFLRALNASITGDWRHAGLEREASQEVAKRLGRDPHSFFIPMDVQQEQRAGMTTGDATFAGNLVATNLLASSFVDLLRNRLSVTRAGATYLGGLVGNIAIPRQTGSVTDYWVGSTDNSVLTGESHPTTDQITMTPKTHGAYTDIGRSLLLQASVDVENMVRTDIATVLALGLDAQALYGTGLTVYPKGIAAQSSVGSVVGGTNGAAPTWANVVALETAVAAANADVDRLSYICNAKTRGYLKSTPKVATYSATMMWDNGSPEAPLNGYNSVVSNMVRSTLSKGTTNGTLSEIFFGNFTDLIIGKWGTLDILVDPYTGGTAGTVRVIALEDADVCVRHGESFARMADALV